MKKDDIIELTIEDLGIDGEGIGKADTNCICFILMLIIFETDKCEAVIRCKAA